MYLGCSALVEATGIVAQCCESCHEDSDEWGYDLCSVEHDGKKYEVCCGVMVAYQDWRSSREEGA